MSIDLLGHHLAHVHDQVVGRPLYLVARVVGAGRDDVPGRPGVSGRA